VRATGNRGAAGASFAGLLRSFRSVKLAVVLILVLVALALAASLVPQGREPSFYLERYPPAFATVLLAVGADRFFRSIPFLVPAGLFTVNLAVCTVHRLASRARAGAPRRHGPDVLHLGLLVLIAGGMTTAFLRQELYFTMAAGDEVRLTAGYSMVLESFRFERWETGAPKAYVSTVRILRDGNTVGEPRAIEVNRPLRVAGIRVYQTSYQSEGVVHLRDAAGATGAIAIGQGIADGEAAWYFEDVEREPGAAEAPGAWTAVFRRRAEAGSATLATLRAAAGGTVGPYAVERVSGRLVTGLTAVRDPGTGVVFVGLAMVAAGLGMTFLQKRKETDA
jgi:cytochrome c biogenesis protein